MKYLYTILFLCVGLNTALLGQFTLLLPDFINNGSIGPESYPPNSYQGTSCTSIELSITFSTEGGDWGGGGGSSLEPADYCDFVGDPDPPCLGDYTDPQQGQCEGCWDFMFFEFNFDGVPVISEFIGASYLTEFEVFTWTSDCLDVGDSHVMVLDAIAQTWSTDETLSLTNIAIVCYEAVEANDVSFDPDNTVCVGEDISLEVAASFPGNYDDAIWSMGGTTVGTGLDLSLTGLTAADAGTYVVETFDGNGCATSAEFEIEVRVQPVANALSDPIEVCASIGMFEGLVDLTFYDPAISAGSGGQVLWFAELSDVPDTEIFDPTNFQTIMTTVYAVVDNGVCLSDPVPVELEITSGIDPVILNSSPVICAGDAIDFEVINVNDPIDFVWDGPPGSGVEDDLVTVAEYMMTGATPEYDGTWTVTVTDVSGCSGTATTEVSISAGPTGTISGGGVLCEGACTDAANDLTINLINGTPPYEVTLDITVLFVTTELVLPAFLPNGSISLCIDPNTFIPSLSDFNSDGQDDIVIPALDIDFNVELTQIVDANGCIGTGSGVITYDIELAPDANIPTGPYSICMGSGFDLTSYNSQINSTASIEWYENPDLTGLIAVPSMYSPPTPNSTVYAIAIDGPCPSNVVSLELILAFAPSIVPIDDTTVCNEYIFDVIGGTNLGPNPYYEDENGNSYQPGESISESGVITINAGDGPGCMATSTFNLEISPTPSLVSPLIELTGCGVIELPEIIGIDVDPSAELSYYTNANFGGDAYLPGTLINQSDGITELFVTINNGPNCFVFSPIDLNFTSAIEYVLFPYPNLQCGDLTLEPIGGASAGVAYFTEPSGAGDEFNQGDLIEAPGIFTFYIFDPSIDQSCVLNGNLSFTIELNEGPEIGQVSDQTVCETNGFILPPIVGTNLDGTEIYTSATNGGGDIYSVGETITENQLVYIFIEGGACPSSEIVFEVISEMDLSAGEDVDIETCIGSVLDLNTLLGMSANQGGTFESSDIILTGTNGNIWDTAGNNTNTTYTINYSVGSLTSLCGTDQSSLLITLTNDVSAGTALLDNEACTGDLVNLFDYLNGASSGGVFVNQNNPMDTLFSGQWEVEGSSTVFEYIISSTGGCDGAMSSFELNIMNETVLSSNFTVDQLCSDDCSLISILASTETDISIQIEQELTGESILLPYSSIENQTLRLCMSNELFEINGDTIYLGTDPANYTISFPSIISLTSCNIDVSNLIDINLSTQDIIEVEIIGEFCEGDEYILNGIPYTTNQQFMGISSSGCDSITNLILTELPIGENFIENTYCTGTSIFIAGVEYMDDATNVVALFNAAVNGCDSIINIDIKFDNASYFVVDDLLCPEDEIQLQGNTYDINNPEDEILLPDGSVAGCDSIITIDLSFYPTSENFYSETLCVEDTVIVAGIAFHQNNISDQILLPQGSSNGCDSIINVSINFFDLVEIDEVYEKCEGESLMVNGITITDDNLTGQYLLTGSGMNCDKLVNYSTLNIQAFENNIDTILCPGDTFVFNGIVYDASNIPTSDIFEEQSILGCDSLIVLNVAYEQSSLNIFEQNLGENSYTFMVEIQGEYQSIFWQNSSSSLSCSDCLETEITIFEDTELSLILVSETGCVFENTISLNYFPPEVETGLYFPNIFSSSSTQGDTGYFIHGTSNYTILEFLIYDRWGNLMFTYEDFKPSDPASAWNGRYQGIEVQPGVYIGLVRYQDESETEQFDAFDITVIR